MEGLEHHHEGKFLNPPKPFSGNILAQLGGHTQRKPHQLLLFPLCGGNSSGEKRWAAISGSPYSKFRYRAKA